MSIIDQCCGKLTRSAAAARPGWSVSVQVGAAHGSYRRAVLWEIDAECSSSQARMECLSPGRSSSWVIRYHRAVLWIQIRIILVTWIHQNPDLHQIKIRTRILIIVIIWIRNRIRIRINLQMTSQNGWNMSLFEHYFTGLSWPFIWKLGSGSGSGSASGW